MKKVLLIIGVLGVSLLNASFFTHNTDKIESYEFNRKKANQEKELASILQRFQEGKVSQAEIERYLHAKTDSSLFAPDVIVRYSTKQTKDFHITQADLEKQSVAQKKDWLVKIVDKIKQMTKTKKEDKKTSHKGVGDAKK
ncbi:hypothetical protein MNB_SM-3-9 [hydrothermal vent metagenome]|uniref:Uncharacterized protein n=1 Tax=hydrothermal vent metagenome TaxID=652676 RepID=A0A1W1D3R9_9ZZZZ